MDVAEFAARLADADDAERAALLERYAALVDSDLARSSGCTTTPRAAIRRGRLAPLSHLSN
jgi:hypothetical protein